jgi:hypothetical protein
MRRDTRRESSRELRAPAVWGWWLVVVATVSVSSACLSDRARPAPPQLTITLSPATVHSPDTLRGTVRATDQDGIDSLWLDLEGVNIIGWDGLLDPEFDSPFAILIPKGRSPGTEVSLTLRARDVTGFSSALDTFVTVIP